MILPGEEIQMRVSTSTAYRRRPRARSIQISPRITVSGHIYDVDSGRVTTVVEPQSPGQA
jgi:hypothetical protein